MLTPADQERLHNLSICNRGRLADAQRAGCFYCCAIFNPTEITDWVDDTETETGGTEDGMTETGGTEDGMTALCPFCGVDAVIPEMPGVTVTPDLLKEMKAHWF